MCACERPSGFEFRMEFCRSEGRWRTADSGRGAPVGLRGFGRPAGCICVCACRGTGACTCAVCPDGAALVGETEMYIEVRASFMENEHAYVPTREGGRPPV